MRLDGQTCPSCGFEWENTYCSNCGERRLEGSVALWPFLRDAVVELTSINGKLFRTLWYLIARPGQLTVDYFDGKRKPYVLPFRLYLLCNLVYFVLQGFSGYHGFNTTLYSQEKSQAYSGMLPIESWVSQRLDAMQVDREIYEEAYNQRSEVYARSLVVLTVPIIALFFMLLWGRSRRYYVEHFVFSLHFMAWMLLFYMSAALYLYVNLFFWLESLITISPTQREFFIETLPVLLLSIYVYFAMRRFSGEGRRVTGVKSFLMVFFIFFAILIYRLMLFVITYLTV